MNFREEQEVERVMVVSTSHVTKNDMDLLEKGETNVVAYNYEFGSFVVISVDFISANFSTEDMAKAIRKDGFTGAFLFLYTVAKAKGFQMIRLDCDGPVYDDLPKFDW